MDHKGNKQWVWLALDADTREIVGVHIGDLEEVGEAAPPASRAYFVALRVRGARSGPRSAACGRSIHSQLKS